MADNLPEPMTVARLLKIEDPVKFVHALHQLSYDQETVIDRESMWLIFGILSGFILRMDRDAREVHRHQPT